ncbi:metalloregulator ArsR/SmtB family transcription factor [Planktotalea sp.]|uniref:ArsR/SmtB family transcription factor n=1 Tax=Planktotalea sp. TaxID=2029877 RepID=UPI0032985D7B
MDTKTNLPLDALFAFTENNVEAPDQAAKFLKSLAHRDRLKVLCVLLDKELSVAEIEARVGASQSAISQHLGRLRDEGIVAGRRDGRQILYSIADPTVRDLIEVLYARFCA